MELPGGMSAERFLQHYWQRRPLVIRQAFPGMESPVSPEEMAGLACEATVESRLVLEQEQGRPWQLHNGPFDAERFAQLPPSHWTLLIQGLDHWVPEAADLQEHFRFIPNWRLDDIMASYAPVGGSVGPHFDQYDVFLVQAMGHRRWTFGGRCDRESPRVAGTPLRILRDWAGEETVTLGPGDMLYLPPGVGHHGVAEDDCITLSVGFRAVTTDDVLTGFTDFLCAREDLSQPLADTGLHVQDNPGYIDTSVIARLQQLVLDKVNDPRALALWFGQYTTAPKSSDIVVPAENELTAGQMREQLYQGETLRWNEGSRFACHDFGDEMALFVDGERYLLRGQASALAPVLCGGNRPHHQRLRELCQDPALAGLLASLHNQGSLYFE